MTFYELLSKFTFEELWYILSMRHDLHDKSIKAECCYRSYKSAFEELLSLHGVGNNKDYLLVCELVTDADDGGAPSSYMDCTVLAPCEDEETGGEKTTYGMDFIPWTELIDVPVSADSLVKYGELICTGELLWEVIFHGYSSKRVDTEAQKLHEIASNPGETVEWNPDDFKFIPDKEKDKSIAEWLSSAPEAVKKTTFDMISSDVTSRDEDDITLDETLQRLKNIIDESTVEIKADCASDVLYAMLRGLDADNQYLLLNTVFRKAEGTE